jgi:hypothetical protein
MGVSLPPRTPLGDQADLIVLAHVEVASGHASLDQWPEIERLDTRLRGERVSFCAGDGFAVAECHEDADRAHKFDGGRVTLRWGWWLAP